MDAGRRARGEQRGPSGGRDRGRRRERLPSAPASGRAGGAGRRRDPSVHGLGSPIVERLGRLPDLEPDPPGSQPRCDPRQRGDLPRAVDRREVEPDPGADREPPAPAGQRRRRLPRRLHRCGVAGLRAGALRRADRALGTPLPRRARQAGRAARWGPATDLRRRPGRRDRALRRQCAAALAEIGFDGYGFGGWPLAADGTLLADPMRWVVESLRPRLRSTRWASAAPITSSAPSRSGYSVFDCALPTRDARHGRLYAFRDGWSSAGPSPVGTSIAPSASTIRRTGSHTDRSRRWTVPFAPVTRRPTCTTCSRSATRRPNGWRRSTTCASTCGSSRCSAPRVRRGRRPAQRPRDRACPGSRCAHERGAR